MEINCPRCNYFWQYKGEKKPNPDYPIYVCCPRCRSNVILKWKMEDQEQKKEKESENHSQK